MLFFIDLGDPTSAVALQEPDDFTKLFVRMDGSGSSERRQSELSRQGRLDGTEHVFVTVDALKGLAGDRAEGPTWLMSLGDLLGYAGSKGRLDSHGAVRAHVDHSS